MNQIALTDDLAARRSAAARKAVATRRARQVLPSINLPSSGAKNTAAVALAAFDREAQSDMPDWHHAALMLKRALAERPQTEPRKLTQLPVALPPPVWHDYEIDRLSAFKASNPTIVVTFEGGEVVRAPAVSAKDKPVNIGRGIRIAVAFCQTRLGRRLGWSSLARRRAAVPAITACICEDTGESYDAKQCTMRTVEARKGRSGNRHDRRRAAGAA